MVIVGGGSAGCALAGRLSEDPARRVLLLESGAAITDPAAFPAEVRDVASLAAADPDGPHTWDVGVDLTPERSTRVGRGRLLGGSSAVNGANHVRATRADLDSWPGWSYDETLPYYIRGEHDHDVRGPLHGDAGPVPVVRPAGEMRAPVTERFLAAAARIGVPAEPDKNGDQPPGAGLVPGNVRRGVRVNAAMAYVIPHLARPNLTVRGDVTVARVLLDGDRAVGVEAVGGERIEAGEVVLSAGSVLTPQLLAISGIGPPDALRAAGLPVRHERPGVGQGYTDHPNVYLAFTGAFTDDGALHPEAPTAQAAVHLDGGDDPAGDLEILLFARPFAPGGACHLMCALQAPESRGTMTFGSDPATPPRLEHHYLASERDRARMRVRGAPRERPARGRRVHARRGARARRPGARRLDPRAPRDVGAPVRQRPARPRRRPRRRRRPRAAGARAGGSAGGRHLGAAHRAPPRTGRHGADARRARGRPHRGIECLTDGVTRA